MNKSTKPFINQVIYLTDVATGLPLYGGVGVISHIEHGGGENGDEIMITIRVPDASDERGWHDLPQMPASQIK